MSDQKLNIYMQETSNETERDKKENQMKLLKQQAEANREYKRNREQKQLEEARIEYPLNIENYKYIDTITFEKLPYILSWIEPDKKYLSISYSGSFSYIKDEYPDNYGKVDFIAIKKTREIIKQNILSGKIKLQDSNQSIYVILPNISKLIKPTVNITPAEEIKFMEVINWLEYEQHLDSNFPLSLPDGLIAHHKFRNSEQSLNKERIVESFCFMLKTDAKQNNFILTRVLTRRLFAVCFNLQLNKNKTTCENREGRDIKGLKWDTVDNLIKKHVLTCGKLDNVLLDKLEPIVLGENFNKIRHAFEAVVQKLKA